MRRSYAYSIAAWVLMCSAYAPSAYTSENQYERSSSTTQADPFGQDDPFAVIDLPETAPAPVGEAALSGNRRPQAQAAVFFKEFYVDINGDSRINPGNNTLALRRALAVLETRLTLADYLNERKTWRWLFRDFISTSNYRENDGTLRRLNRIDELFTDWRKGAWFASLGKRRVNWGHAQGFNPINVVAPPRNPLDPSYQTEGQVMGWLSHTGVGTMDLIVTRDYDENYASDQNRWGARWGIAASESDYAVYYFDGANYRDGRAFERMLGASFSANVIPGLTVYMEGASFSHNYRNYYSANGVGLPKNGYFFQGVVGTLADLGGKSSLFLEYFYNGQGYSGDERRNYLQTADSRLGSGDMTLVGDFANLAMNRNYVLANYRKEYRENYLFSSSLLVAEDASFSARAAGFYTFSDYYELRISYVRNGGGRGSEFGNSPYNGLLEVGFNAIF